MPVEMALDLQCRWVLAWTLQGCESDMHSVKTTLHIENFWSFPGLVTGLVTLSPGWTVATSHSSQSPTALRGNTTDNAQELLSCDIWQLGLNTLWLPVFASWWIYPSGPHHQSAAQNGTGPPSTSKAVTFLVCLWLEPRNGIIWNIQSQGTVSSGIFRSGYLYTLPCFVWFINVFCFKITFFVFCGNECYCWLFQNYVTGYSMLK